MSPKSFRSESEMSPELVSYRWKQVHCYPVTARPGCRWREGRKDLKSASIKGRCDHSVNETGQHIWSFRHDAGCLKMTRYQKQMICGQSQQFGPPGMRFNRDYSSHVCVRTASLHKSLHAGLLKCISPKFPV